MRGMTAAELNELRLFHEQEPIGELRGDVRAGMIAATIANVNRKQDSEPFTALDFMPYAKRPPEPAPILLDAEAQSQLIMTAVFKRKSSDI